MLPTGNFLLILAARASFFIALPNLAVLFIEPKGNGCFGAAQLVQLNEGFLRRLGSRKMKACESWFRRES